LIDVLPPDSTDKLPPVHEPTETRGGDGHAGLNGDGHAGLNEGDIKLYMLRELVSRWTFA
jgi:hypothetical protein